MHPPRDDSTEVDAIDGKDGGTTTWLESELDEQGIAGERRR
jgi:hypothetical protein